MVIYLIVAYLSYQQKNNIGLYLAKKSKIFSRRAKFPYVYNISGCELLNAIFIFHFIYLSFDLQFVVSVSKQLLCG